VILIVGVNGTGKTTSTAKLAHYLQVAAIDHNRPTQVMLAAADTFRAAAIEQLGIWAERLGIEMIRGQYGGDPAALCYEAYEAAAKRGIDFLLCDTAGRQHTKTNLMAELQKVKRAIGKLDPDAPHETLLVVDATTGGNALSQAREFHNALGLTGLVATKLDGSGKGGIVVAIQDELRIPTRFVGTGEKIDDFAPFDAREFIANML
jgi:fused signal recognition particle receptor